MRKLLMLVILALAAGFVAAPQALAAAPGPKKLVLALDGRFTTPGTSAGGFVAGGAVSDSGTHHDVTAVFPKQGRPTRIVITVTCVGKKGAVTLVATVPVAKAGFLGPGTSIASIRGATRIVKATGSYAGWAGAVTSDDLSFTSNPLQPGVPGAPKATLNAVRVIDVFTR
jgi:hypothetical protein